MRIEKIPGPVLLGALALAMGPAIAPRFARWGVTPPRSAALAADQDKKEEEPKGDPVDVDKLPKAVVDAVKKEMPGARITKAAKLDDGNFFLDDVKVGKKLWDVTISPKGKIIKKVEMKEND